MSNTLSLGRQQTKDPKTWSPLLGESFVFFDDGSSQFFPFISPFFLVTLVYLCLAGFHHTRLSIPFFSSGSIMCFSNQSCTPSWQCVHVCHPMFVFTPHNLAQQ